MTLVGYFLTRGYVLPLHRKDKAKLAIRISNCVKNALLHSGHLHFYYLLQKAPLKALCIFYKACQVAEIALKSIAEF